jgi:hypothetical protein
LRIYAPEPEKLLAQWKKNWPAPNIRFLRERWVDPDMEDVFTAYSQRYDALLDPGKTSDPVSQNDARATRNPMSSAQSSS